MSTGSVDETQRHISSPNHAALALHQKLPFELLSEIFVQCISVEFRELTRLYGIRPSLVFGQRWMYPHHIRARLALVCRAWHTVLYNEPRVWTIMFLTPQWHPETVSLWMKKSESMPLVVFIPDWKIRWGSDTLFSMLRKEMWRIRYLFWDISEFMSSDLPALFPLEILTNAPVLQSLALCRIHERWFNEDTSELGNIHCPELRTLFLHRVDSDIKSLTVRPLKNLHHLSIDQDYNFQRHTDNMMYLKLLETLPNLVSLSWKSARRYTPVWDGPCPRIVLRDLESLILEFHCKHTIEYVLKSLQVPSLKRLVLELFAYPDLTSTSTLYDVCHSFVQLRHLTLRGRALRGSVPALLSHLNQLETLTIENLHDADGLFVALSSHNSGSSTLCPCLKTVDISHDVDLMPDVLVEFVQQRVKSDLDDPAPGLVTCLKLGRGHYDEKLCAQLVKTHGSSISFRVRRYEGANLLCEKVDLQRTDVPEL